MLVSTGMKKKVFHLVGPILVVLTLVTGCSEKSGSKKDVALPNVMFVCRSTNCLVNSTRIFYIFYTTSGCSRPDFGLVASGSVSVNCTATNGCAGVVTNWTTTSGSTTVNSATYDVCGFGDMNNNWSGQKDIGDSSGATSIFLDSDTPTQSINAWTNVTT